MGPLRDRLTNPDGQIPPDEHATARQRALRRIEAKRRFRVEVVAAGIATGILVLIWSFSEYHNAGGWPVDGFSQSSGIHDVWNYWIIYPVMAIGIVIAARAWFLFGNRPPSEDQIKREMEREENGRKAA